MGKFHDTIPSDLVTWANEQRCFWVATAPLSGKGHINVSPKGIPGTFKILDEKTFFYQDLTGSGVETSAHLRENGRITVLFNAFEGPPRILRLFGTGEVHELGTPRYNELIPPEERIAGSRAVVIVNVHKVGTSCGFSVPLYKPDGERDLLTKISTSFEEFDQSFVAEKEDFEQTTHVSHLKFIPSSENSKQDARHPRGLKQYWSESNIRSIDGLPALQFCRELAGLPPTQVEADKKLFHQDITTEKTASEFAVQARKIAGKVEETGFAGGLVVGLACALTWVWLTAHGVS
ncbi:hypothetical protein BDV93DRAFT_523510 [Ceratobasidium sp. AG-I]|nr:hypothetical protein BDV93DRAFT_523510 [Ceratobasidium sp. AG-I]